MLPERLVLRIGGIGREEVVDDRNDDEKSFVEQEEVGQEDEETRAALLNENLAGMSSDSNASSTISFSFPFSNSLSFSERT